MGFKRLLIIVAVVAVALSCSLPRLSAQTSTTKQSDEAARAENAANVLSNAPRVPASNAQAIYRPITKPERFHWFVYSTIGTRSLGAGVVSAGWGTWLSKPEEYDTHWVGFAKRYGMRLSGVSTGNAIEAGLGMAMNEDPRYFRPVGLRGNVSATPRQ
jgi:hypothetical protein